MRGDGARPKAGRTGCRYVRRWGSRAPLQTSQLETPDALDAQPVVNRINGGADRVDAGSASGHVPSRCRVSEDDQEDQQEQEQEQVDIHCWPPSPTMSPTLEVATHRRSAHAT